MPQRAEAWNDAHFRAPKKRNLTRLLWAAADEINSAAAEAGFSGRVNFRRDHVAAHVGDDHALKRSSGRDIGAARAAARSAGDDNRIVSKWINRSTRADGSDVEHGIIRLIDGVGMHSHSHQRQGRIVRINPIVAGVFRGVKCQRRADDGLCNRRLRWRASSCGGCLGFVAVGAGPTSSATAASSAAIETAFAGAGDRIGCAAGGVAVLSGDEATAKDSAGDCCAEAA
jgi:hypothetical protein